MRQSPSICFVSPFAYPLLVEGGAGAGGAERQFFLFGRALAERGWHVSFITDWPQAQLADKPTAYPVLPVDFSYLGGSKWRVPVAWMSFIGAMRRAEADFYVLKTPWHLLPMMVLFGRCYRKKIVFWGQTTPAASGRQAARGGWFQRLESWSVKRADLVMAQTREQGDYFAQDYGVQASVIPSICDALIPDWQCKVTGSRCKSVDVLWVGNQLPNKRQEVVLELARQTPEYQYALALKITDRARFEQTRKAAEAVPNLLMLGEVAHVEMEKWFKQTRVFLSTSGREGFPNTFLQAWMNGVPVVSLGVDPDGLIQERLLGRVAYPGCATEPAADPVKLAASLVGILREILENEQLRLTMGENGRRYVKDNHAPERVVPALVEALARVQ